MSAREDKAQSPFIVDLRSPGSSGATIPSEPSRDDVKSALPSPPSKVSSLMLLALMVFQNSSAVLVGRHTRSSVPAEELYVVNHFVLVTEFTKLILACGLEYMTTKGQLYTSIQEHIFRNPSDALKIMVPALLYLVQNSLLYTALSNLSAPFFQVTYQGKLVVTAVFSVLMLQRKYSLKQWLCLLVLSCGVAIVVLGENKTQETDRDDQSLTLGVTAVTIVCLCSALAGVYFEKVLKKQDAAPVSLWMRNIQLAFFSLLIAFLQGLLMTKPDDDRPYLHGFHGWVWVLVCIQAGGGMLIAAVIKYADNVLKGLAVGVSVVVATLCSMVLFGTPLTRQFTLGACMILCSVYLFSNTAPRIFQVKYCFRKDSGGAETKQLVLPS